MNTSTARKITLLHGYSLIEVVVVIFVMMILFGLGIANFQSYTRRKAFEGIVKSIESDLILTRQYALLGKKPDGCTNLESYTFQTSGANTYEIFVKCASGPPVPKIKTVKIGSLYHLSFVNPNRPPTPETSKIYFNVLDRGVKTNDTGLIRLSISSPSQGFESFIRITRSGLISIE